MDDPRDEAADVPASDGAAGEPSTGSPAALAEPDPAARAEGLSPLPTDPGLDADRLADTTPPPDIAIESAGPSDLGDESEDEMAAELKPPHPAIALERKHLLAIRWMHWINFPVLFTMIWSGLLIYWNDSDNAYKHPHEVYRVGVGSWTLFRFFPDWFYKALNVPYQVTEGLSYHFFFMWFFAINGIVYVAYLLWSREWKFIFPDRKSLVEAIQVTLVDLRLRKGLPPQTKYNGAQKIAYTSVIGMGFGALVTGLAIYKPTSVHWLTTLLGGYEMARWEHFWLTIGFCAFFLIHVWQVAMAGWNNFRSMVSGYELRPVTESSLEAERSKF